jgi:hypothetical protein
LQTKFQDRLDTLIKTLNITPTLFAKTVGTSKQNIFNYLKGAKIPGAKVLEKIMLANPSLSEQWLISGKGEMWKVRDSDDDRERESNKLNETEEILVIRTLKNEIERFYNEIKVREKILKMIEKSKIE